MIVKASISFLSEDSDADLIIRSNGILIALTGNPTYPQPSPTLAVVNAGVVQFTNAVSAAAGGGMMLTSAKNDKRADLVALLRDLASYVQLRCKGDLTKLLSSGFPVQKTQRQPVGILPAPANLTVKLGGRSGQLDSKVEPVPGASIYNWRCTPSTSPSAPVQTPQTTAGSHTFSGLTPGMVYSVEVNAVGSAGPSNWSIAATQMVL